jgi:TonB family protein
MGSGVTRLLAALALAGMVFLPAQSIFAQAHPNRKVITKVMPNYPELARRMHVQGSVKLEAVVRPDGVVKSTRVIGGNPVLLQPAADALIKWKFEAVQDETTEIVQLTFQP